MPSCQPETRESAVTPVLVVAALLLNSSLTKPKTSHDDRAFQPSSACGRLAFLPQDRQMLAVLQRSDRKIMAVIPKTDLADLNSLKHHHLAASTVTSIRKLWN